MLSSNAEVDVEPDTPCGVDRSRVGTAGQKLRRDLAASAKREERPSSIVPSQRRHQNTEAPSECVPVMFGNLGGKLIRKTSISSSHAVYGFCDLRDRHSPRWVIEAVGHGNRGTGCHSRGPTCPTGCTGELPIGAYVFHLLAAIGPTPELSPRKNDYEAKVLIRQFMKLKGCPRSHQVRLGGQSRDEIKGRRSSVAAGVDECVGTTSH